MYPSILQAAVTTLLPRLDTNPEFRQVSVNNHPCSNFVDDGSTAFLNDKGKILELRPPLG